MALSHVDTSEQIDLNTSKMEIDNSSDKWSDAESIDEFVMSELKEDTGFYKKLISGDLGPEDDWGDLSSDEDDAPPILFENHRELNQTSGSDANHSTNGENVNCVESHQRQNSAQQIISNLAATGDVSLAVVINGVVASIQSLIVQNANVQPLSIVQQMNMPQTSNQSIESVAETSFIGVHSSPQMSNQPDESISETSFIGAHSLPQKQEEPVDIPTEQIDFIEPPNDQRLTKTDYCKEVTTGAPLPPFYNEVKLFLKSKKSTRGLSSKRDNMQSVRNDDHRLNRPGIRPHLNRIAHPDAESKRISLSTQGKKSSSRSIFDLSPSKSKSSHEHKKLKPEKHTARKSDVKSRQNGSSHKSIDKSKLLPEKSKLKLETKRNSARVEDESTPMQNKDFDNNAAKATISGKDSKPLLSSSYEVPQQPSCSYKQGENKTKVEIAKEAENLTLAVNVEQNERQMNIQPNDQINAEMAKDLEIFEKIVMANSPTETETVATPETQTVIDSIEGAADAVTTNSNNISTFTENCTHLVESLRINSESDNETVVMPREIDHSTTNAAVIESQTIALIDDKSSNESNETLPVDGMTDGKNASEGVVVLRRSITNSISDKDVVDGAAPQLDIQMNAEQEREPSCSGMAVASNQNFNSSLKVPAEKRDLEIQKRDSTAIRYAVMRTYEISDDEETKAPPKRPSLRPKKPDVKSEIIIIDSD